MLFTAVLLGLRLEALLNPSQEGRRTGQPKTQFCYREMTFKSQIQCWSKLVFSLYLQVKVCVFSQLSTKSDLQIWETILPLYGGAQQMLWVEMEWNRQTVGSGTTIIDFMKSSLIEELKQTHGWFSQIGLCPPSCLGKDSPGAQQKLSPTIRQPWTSQWGSPPIIFWSTWAQKTLSDIGKICDTLIQFMNLIIHTCLVPVMQCNKLTYMCCFFPTLIFHETSLFKLFIPLLVISVLILTRAIL